MSYSTSTSASRRSTPRSSASGSNKSGRSRQSDARPYPQQRRRSVRFDGGGQGEYDDYGFMNDEDELTNSRYMSTPVPLPPSTYPQLDTLDGYSGAGLPLPATACVIMQGKGKKESTFGRRLREAFVSVTANPEIVAAGCIPGKPTPYHILDREVEEEAEEEKKRVAEEKRKEELVRQSKARRASVAEASRRERRAQEARERGYARGRSQSVPLPQMMPSYNARIAEEYARESARRREYDNKQRVGRLSTQPSKYARQQYAEQQQQQRQREQQSQQQWQQPPPPPPQQQQHQYEQQQTTRPRAPSKLRNEVQLQSGSQSGKEYDFELELLAGYDTEHDFPNPPRPEVKLNPRLEKILPLDQQEWLKAFVRNPNVIPDLAPSMTPKILNRLPQSVKV